VTPELLARLAAGPEAAVTVEGRLEPFPARYELAALPALLAALDREQSVRAALAALEPGVIGVEAREVASVNTPAELAAARDA
jgi:molybdopterin-guanine dinucleotide biosynthesis protein A